MSNYYRFNCSECNGTQLSWRGDAWWNPEINDWDFREDSIGDAYCHDCDAEVKVRDNGVKANDTK